MTRSDPRKQNEIKKITKTMVDVDRRIPPSLSASHAAGLRRLSTRASSSTATATPRTAGLHSLAPLASSLVSLFKLSRIPLSPGLSEPELVRIESHFNFTFPPDLRAVLSLAVPSAPGFPDWRSRPSLSALFRFPTISLSLQLSAAARSGLRRAPLLVPLYGRCYLPSRPSLAGNPVFFIDEDRVFCCALDLRHFFSFRFVSPSPVSTSARWIEFWTDASTSFDRRRKRSSSSSERSSSSSSASSMSSSVADLGPDPERFVEIRPPKVPGWVGKYMERIGSALKKGGWGEEEVEEMVHVSASCSMDCEEEVLMDVLALRADRWSESLRRAGWSPAEVAVVLGSDLGFLGRRRQGRSRKTVKLPPEIQSKMEKLAEELLR